jgi:heat induced stress protein YflT
MSKAEQAVRELDREGFPIQQVSIIGHDPERELKVQGYVTVADMAKKGIDTGALAVGAFGLLAGAVSVWIPGLGHLRVAGPSAAAMRRIGRAPSMSTIEHGHVWSELRVDCFPPPKASSLDHVRAARTPFWAPMAIVGRRRVRPTGQSLESLKRLPS